MALIQCPDCGNKISDQAPACPHCGRPNAAATPSQPHASSTSEKERLLLEVHPSRWQYFWDYAFFFLIIPPLIGMWKRSSFTLSVHSNRVVLQKGMLSRDIKEIFCSDVRSVEVRQGLFQRLVGIGDIVIGNSASDSEEVAFGIPDPTGVKDLILAQKRGGARGLR